MEHISQTSMIRIVNEHSGCISIFALASLLAISVGITISSVEVNTCAITAGIKKYK